MVYSKDEDCIPSWFYLGVSRADFSGSRVIIKASYEPSAAAFKVPKGRFRPQIGSQTSISPSRTILCCKL